MKTKQIVPIIIVPPAIRPKGIENGCVNKPGCNSQVVYILPYMKAA
jgi:hypothetical protein